MKKPNVTIAICAYNEEKNIGRLLSSLISQRKEIFKLDQVLIVDDGSVDSTARIVEKYRQAHKVITLQKMKNNIGKLACINEVLKKNTSDILVFLDADVVPTHDCVVESLVLEFTGTRKVDLVGGVTIPTASNFISEVAATWVSIWNLAKREYSDYDTVHNMSACIMALSKRFASKLSIPAEVVVDDQYFYFRSKELEYNFRLAKNATATYKVPATVYDYWLQSVRYLHCNNYIFEYFGSWVLPYYKITEKAKLRAFISVFLVRPVPVFIAVVFQVVLRVTSPLLLKRFEVKKWQVAESTK